MDKQCMLEIQTALKDKGLDGLAFLWLSAREEKGWTTSASKIR
jgi:hypothetical protein